MLLQDRARTGFDAILARLSRLEKLFGLSEVAGLVVGFVVGRGMLGDVTGSPLFIPIFVAISLSGAIIIRLLIGSDLRRQIAVAFYILTWMIGLVAISILGIAIAALLGSPSFTNAGVLFFSLAFYLYVARSKIRAREMLGVDSEGALPSKDNDPVTQGWFREEDLNLFSKRRSFLMAGYGVLVGLVVSTLITVYAGVLYNPLFNWLWSGVVVGTVLVASLGLLRNRVLKRVAARGFPAVFRFRRIAFTFYIYSVLTGALGLGYGYGYFSAQSTILVLPLAGLFILFLYLYLLWRDVLVGSEEGRLCIFQFIAEHGEDGSGFSWLKRGLAKTRSLLESFGVSAKRNSLYFGSSYSLLEGSYLEWDLDNIYFLGDWTSEPNEMRPVHEIASWFLHRSKKAEKRGFSRVFSLIDHLYEVSPQSAYYIIAAVGVLVGIVTALLRR